MAPEVTGSKKTPDERKELLARLVSSRISLGRRVESQSDYQAVLVAGKPVNHILHLILTIISLGIWGIIWLALVALGGEKREVVQIDEWGNTSVARM